MLPVMVDLQHEEFWIVLLNQECKAIKKMHISSVGIDGTVADVRVILKTCFIEKYNAACYMP